MEERWSENKIKKLVENLGAPLSRLERMLNKSAGEIMQKLSYLIISAGDGKCGKSKKEFAYYNQCYLREYNKMYRKRTKNFLMQF